MIGKVKRVKIKAKDLVVGMPVLYSNATVYFVKSFETKHEGYHPTLKTYVMLGTKEMILLGCHVEYLSTLVIEFEGYLPFKTKGQKKDEPSDRGLYTVPLIFDQWAFLQC